MNEEYISISCGHDNDFICLNRSDLIKNMDTIYYNSPGINTNKIADSFLEYIKMQIEEHERLISNNWEW